MARFRNLSTDDEAETAIDISPLIDCVFILLIFFIVTTVFVEETGVEVDKPQAASAVQLEKNSILIAVTDKDEVVFGGRDIGVNGVHAEVKRQLTKEPNQPVIVQADKASHSDTLVRVVDQAKLAGAKKVSLASRIGRN